MSVSKQRPVDMGAEFSEDRTYRYSLWRFWAPQLPVMAVIGLNPSTADETTDDPTIRRCLAYARCWGYGGLWMLNLFGYRSTDPKKLRTLADPVGPGNDEAILGATSMAYMVVAAWGNDGAIRGREQQVQALLSDIDVHCLRRNKNGSPAHPLYLPGNLTPSILWPKEAP